MLPAITKSQPLSNEVERFYRGSNYTALLVISHTGFITIREAASVGFQAESL